MGGSDATIAGEAAALMHLQLDGVLLAGGRHQLDEWPAETGGARVELPAAPPLREHSALVHRYGVRSAAHRRSRRGTSVGQCCIGTQVDGEGAPRTWLGFGSGLEWGPGSGSGSGFGLGPVRSMVRVRRAPVTSVSHTRCRCGRML
jgi:hypothetical protein